MGPDPKARLLGLLYEAKHAALDEKAAAWEMFYAEVDRVRAPTPYSRQQVKELLLKDGYLDYARRRRQAEHLGL